MFKKLKSFTTNTNTNTNTITITQKKTQKQKQTMSGSLHELVGGDVVIFRDIAHEWPTMTAEERHRKISDMINRNTPRHNTEGQPFATEVTATEVTATDKIERLKEEFFAPKK